MLILPSHNLLKGLFAIWHVLDTTNASRFEGNLPNLTLISTIFDEFIKPYLKTWHSEPSARAFEAPERTVESVVRQKIKQLQPFLQDDDFDETEMENEITFEGNGETTIIEFVPKMNDVYKKGLRNDNDTFKANMRKYKRVRNKIYQALEAEMISNKTKTFVMRTLDELLSKMVETQCHWKGGLRSAGGNNIESSDRKFIIPITLVNIWKEEWEKFKDKFLVLSHQSEGHQINNFDILMLLTRLNSIINDILVNLESFSQKYRIRCEVSERKDLLRNKPKSKKRGYFRLSDFDNDILCNNFKVCSKELKTFFIDFYKSLNETSVNVLRSYAEMFTRDVNTDVSNEKNSIVDLIFKIGDKTEKDVITIFIKYTTEFKLDEHKDKKGNIKFLSDHVKDVIQHIKEEVNKNVIVQLKHLHKKVFSSIHQDVMMNLKVDLENLERDFTGKICLIFDVCNGNPKYRRQGNKENAIDENKVYVKVELTIDEERNELSKKDNSDVQAFRTVSKNTKLVTNFATTRHFKDGSNTLMSFDNYANVNVTRTTLTTPS